MSWSWQWRTNSPESPGLCCRAVMIITQSRYRWLHNQTWKTLTFHISSNAGKLKITHRRLQRNRQDERTVKTADLKPAGANGLPWPSYLSGQERGVSHHGQEIFSTERPDTLTQTSLIPQLFPCSQAADHTLHQSLLAKGYGSFQSAWRTLGHRNDEHDPQGASAKSDKK